MFYGNGLPLNWIELKCKVRKSGLLFRSIYLMCFFFLHRKRGVAAQPLSPITSAPSCTRSNFCIAKMHRTSIMWQSLSSWEFRPPCSKEKVIWRGPPAKRILNPKIGGFLGESDLCCFFVITFCVANREKKEIIQLVAWWIIEEATKSKLVRQITENN